MSTPSLVEDLFLAALEKGTAEERAAYLEDACKDDPDLRRRVERLLEAHPKAGRFLEPPIKPTGGETAAYVPADEHAGTIIGGRYKLLEQIGEGGMGTVWVAEQTVPVRRKVALKLIKAGMDSKAVLARFEAERQALALMDHPNIARVLDGGTSEGGRPYFVMEYVKGIPFTDYCDNARLSIAQRLALFVPVCQAVQHAHQKGVIHRDLKPSNILVCLYDGQPVPKVIDFGLAKAMHQPLTEHTLHTAHGAMLGTPLYMSPEQAEFNNLDVDTRTDIYALGVMLYELLTGTTPLERQRFREAAWLEMLRLIKEEEPPRPSVRLSASGSLPSLAAQRQLEPVKLTRLVRGELDWIVMKCLEKDRSRRYATAIGLARDVERYLADEVIEARPASAGYRLRKFVRKHRVSLATTVAFMVLLFASALVSGWMAMRAKRAEVLADEKRSEAETNAETAQRSVGIVMNALLDSDKSKSAVEMLAASLRVDLDLANFRSDPRVGILRLTQTLKAIPDDRAGRVIKVPKEMQLSYSFPSDTPGQPSTPLPEMRWGVEDTPDGPLVKQRQLREFVTSAVIVLGQEYAPLLPPITHDGHEVTQLGISPDHGRLVTLGEDGTARLWETLKARQIAILRQGAEKVVNCGISTDGKTVFTGDQAGVARFWDSSDGKYRARTEPRPTNYATGIFVPSFPGFESVLIAGNRLLTRRVEGHRGAGAGIDRALTAPVELWDTTTGRLVARLNQPGLSIEDFQFQGDGRWITTVTDNRSTIVVFAAVDGRLVGRLTHPVSEQVTAISASPSGRQIAILMCTKSDTRPLRIWDTKTWKASSPLRGVEGAVHFLTDELLGLEYHGFGGIFFTDVYRLGQPATVTDVGSRTCDPLLPSGDFVLTDEGQVFDTRTGQRLVPPAGRKYHPTLTRFAADGRFVVTKTRTGMDVAIDTRTDKSLELRNDSYKYGYIPGTGLSTAPMTANQTVQIHLLPTTALKDIPANLLTLWAQVAVCGELAADGTFKKWDEPTWERKRQELAAKQPPVSGLPFPGYLAKDKLHWLRKEFESADDAKKSQIAKQLLDRAEAVGDKVEAVRWRAALAPRSRPSSPKESLPGSGT